MSTQLVLFSGFLDKTNFPRILTRDRNRQDSSTIPYGSVPELCLALPWSAPAGGTRHRSPVPITPWGTIRRIFPRIIPRGAKGIRIATTPLQSPHGPVPDICLALPLRTAAGGTWQGLLCPFTPWGSIKRIFPEY